VIYVSGKHFRRHCFALLSFEKEQDAFADAAEPK